MENVLYLGEITAHTYQSERHQTIFFHTVELYITHVNISTVGKSMSILSIKDKHGNMYQVGVCPSSTWKSYYSAKNGNGYRYMAGPYYIESLNIVGFENDDIPLFKNR